MEGNIIRGRNGRWRRPTSIGPITFTCATIKWGCKKSGGITGQAASSGSWPSVIQRAMRLIKHTSGSLQAARQVNSYVTSMYYFILAHVDHVDQLGLGL